MPDRFAFRCSAIVVVALTATIAGQAPNFKVQKIDIKGDGGTDYVTVEPATHRVFVARSTHVMVVDGSNGKVLGDIPNTPGVHGAALVTKTGHGFTTNGGDQTVTMFDLKTLAVIKQIKVGPGLDGIMYDESDDKVVLTRHSRPVGTLTALNPETGDIVATVDLEDTGPEGAAADGKGHIFVNNEGKSTMQVIDAKSWKATASWPLAPCDGPTGIAYDSASNRVLVGCSRTSVVVDPTNGKVVATIANGTRVDALGWDPAEKLMYIPNGGEGNVTVAHQDSPDKYTVVGCSRNSVVVDPTNGKVVATIANGTRVDALGWDPAEKLMYIPNGGEGNVTVAHQDSPDKYTVVATVTTFPGAKTITIDPTTHTAYLFQPERGPVPATTEPAPAPTGGQRGRGPQGPVIAGWFMIVTH